MVRCVFWLLPERARGLDRKEGEKLRPIPPPLSALITTRWQITGQEGRSGGRKAAILAALWRKRVAVRRVGSLLSAARICWKALFNSATMNCRVAAKGSDCDLEIPSCRNQMAELGFQADSVQENRDAVVFHAWHSAENGTHAWLGDMCAAALRVEETAH